MIISITSFHDAVNIVISPQMSASFMTKLAASYDQDVESVSLYLRSSAMRYSLQLHYVYAYTHYTCTMLTIQLH